MVRIKFDMNDNPISPTFVLAKRSGEKIGLLQAFEITASESFMNPSEVSFKVYKEYDGVLNPYWNEIKNFRLVWCEEWQNWYQLVVDLNESTETTKQISMTSLCEAELSQLSLDNIEINTEDDMERDDYIVSVLYDDTSDCILNRLLQDKATHYYIKHVDDSIKNIQRAFSFDNTTIYDAFKDIEEEIGCVFVFGEFEQETLNDARRMPVRTISVYDLQNICEDGHRTESSDECDECGLPVVQTSYGDDTTIFVSADELAEEIHFTTDTDSVKNFLRLDSGDDFMTDMIRACNCGSNYIFYFNDETLADMSSVLRDSLQEYQQSYEELFDEHRFEIDSTHAEQYNIIAEKYSNDDTTYISVNGDSSTGYYILNYDNLMTMLFDATDLKYYLDESLMPDITMQETNAKIEADKLKSSAFPTVAVNNYASISTSTAKNAVFNMAKYLVDARYHIEVETESFTKNANNHTWKGTFTLTNWSDENDTATTSTVTVTVNGDYATFVQQRIDIGVKNFDDSDYSIVGLFKKEIDDFKSELKKYGLSSLQRFYDCADQEISILVELGANDSSNSAYSTYQDYQNKQRAVTDEIKAREDEIEVVDALIEEISKYQTSVRTSMDLRAYITNIDQSYWEELCSFRRDGAYSNDNYISDGLTNVELLKNAKQFIHAAKQELIKSAEQQHSISTTLRNLLCIDKFKPLVNKFKVGNWIRVRVDDMIYKLRLIKYEIDFDNLDNLSVDFSDVLIVANGITDLRSLYQNATKMATSFDAVTRQVANNDNTTKKVDTWIENGLDLTNMRILNNADNQTTSMTRNGMLFRSWDYNTNDYAKEQLKITNSTLAITKDGWETAQAAIGYYYYVDPITGNPVSTYGIIGDTIVGRLILGETLQLRNKENNLLFNDEGLFTGIDNDVQIFANGSVNIGDSIVYDSSTQQLDIRVNRLTLSGEDGTSYDMSDASKTATNFIDYTPAGGLQIGNKVNGSWSGARARIRNGSYEVLSQNGNLLASFGEETILGDRTSHSHFSFTKNSLNIAGWFSPDLEDGKAPIHGFSITADAAFGISMSIDEPRGEGLYEEVSYFQAFPNGLSMRGTRAELGCTGEVDIYYLDEYKHSLLYYNRVDNFDERPDAQGLYIGKQYIGLDHLGATYISCGVDDEEKPYSTIRIVSGSTVNYAIHTGNLQSYVNSLSSIDLNQNSATNYSTNLYLNRRIGSVNHRSMYGHSSDGSLYIGYMSDANSSMTTQNFILVGQTQTYFQKAINANTLVLTNALGVAYGGTGCTSVITTEGVGSVLTATTNDYFTITGEHLYRWGKVVQVRFTLSVKKALSAGNITDIQIGTIKTSTLRPINLAFLSDTQCGVRAYINNENGHVTVSGLAVALSSGASINLLGTYIIP